MITSMTGYATRSGEAAQGYRWTWELRAVNGKGLDLRLRVPDWIDGLEAALRAEIGKAAARGNITLSLRLTRETAETGLRLNAQMLGTVLGALRQIEERARAEGLALAPASAADILALRGVLEHGSEEGDSAALKALLLADLAPLLADFTAMRQGEGRRLGTILARQVAEVARLTEAASALIEARQDAFAAGLRRNLARIMDSAEAADEARVAQELAMIAVKADVTEEIDRLRAHVAAAQDLLADGGPVGRKLDFLMQEFNREANTLCAKAQMTALTETGLALKVLIDQMREQVQNVE